MFMYPRCNGSVFCDDVDLVGDVGGSGVSGGGGSPSTNPSDGGVVLSPSVVNSVVKGGVDIDSGDVIDSVHVDGLDFFHNLDMLHKCFRFVFGVSLGIFSKFAKNYGTSSSVIYLPRRYTGCAVTLIVWPKGILPSDFIVEQGLQPGNVGNRKKPDAASDSDSVANVSGDDCV